MNAGKEAQSGMTALPWADRDETTRLVMALLIGPYDEHGFGQHKAERLWPIIEQANGYISNIEDGADRFEIQRKLAQAEALLDGERTRPSPLIDLLVMAGVYERCTELEPDAAIEVVPDDGEWEHPSPVVFPNGVDVDIDLGPRLERDISTPETTDENDGRNDGWKTTDGKRQMPSGRPSGSTAHRLAVRRRLVREIVESEPGQRAGDLYALLIERGICRNLTMAERDVRKLANAGRIRRTRLGNDVRVYSVPG
jgi:hypothetical protein